MTFNVFGGTLSLTQPCSVDHTATHSRTPPATVALTLVQHVTHSGPEVFFKTCVAMKFVDDDDDVKITEV